MQHPASAMDESVAQKSAKPEVDIVSQKGAFGWVSIEDNNVPYVLRDGNPYVSVRMIEHKLLSRYPSTYPEEISKRPPLVSEYITPAEANLFDEINRDHCGLEYGPAAFTIKDIVVKLVDFKEFFEIVRKHFDPQPLEVVPRVEKPLEVPPPTGGWLQVNNTVVPYVRRLEVKLLPVSILQFSAGLLKDLQVEGYDLTEPECAYLTKLCAEAKVTFQFKVPTKVLPAPLVCQLSKDKVFFTELSEDDPFDEAVHLDDVASAVNEAQRVPPIPIVPTTPAIPVVPTPPSIPMVAPPQSMPMVGTPHSLAMGAIPQPTVMAPTQQSMTMGATPQQMTMVPTSYSMGLVPVPQPIAMVPTSHSMPMVSPPSSLTPIGAPLSLPMVASSSPMTMVSPPPYPGSAPTNTAAARPPCIHPELLQAGFAGHQASPNQIPHFNGHTPVISRDLHLAQVAGNAAIRPFNHLENMTASLGTPHNPFGMFNAQLRPRGHQSLAELEEFHNMLKQRQDLEQNMLANLAMHKSPLESHVGHSPLLSHAAALPLAPQATQTPLQPPLPTPSSIHDAIAINRLLHHGMVAPMAAGGQEASLTPAVANTNTPSPVYRPPRPTLRVPEIPKSFSHRKPADKIQENKTRCAQPSLTTNQLKQLSDSDAIRALQQVHRRNVESRHCVIQQMNVCGKTVSCLVNSNGKFALVEALCKVFFPHKKLDHLRTALESSLNIPYYQLSKEEEQAFIKFYDLPADNLTCRTVINVHHFEYNLSKLYTAMNRAEVLENQKITNAVDSLNNLKNSAMDTLSNQKNKAVDMLSNQKNNALDMLSHQKNNVKDTLSNQKNNVMDMLSTQKSNANDMLSNQKNNVMDTLGKQKNSTIDVVSHHKNSNVVGSLSNQKNTVSDILNSQNTSNVDKKRAATEETSKKSGGPGNKSRKLEDVVKRMKAIASQMNETPSD